MLCLSRKPGESIQIGDDIELVVVGVRGDRVRLGVRAPAAVKILRSELKIMDDNDATAKPAA